MEYTKGEWKAYRDSLTKEACCIDVEHTGHEKVYTEIALVYHKQNANLIAASPALYETLTFIADHIDYATGPEAREKLRLMATKALAKAEGRT